MSNAPTVQRETFTTSRTMDYFTKEGLETETGHPARDWPLVLLKELLDNALDACEEGGTAPRVTVTMGAAGITVADNGPGIPPGVVRRFADFSTRTSSRAHYAAPDRGAQGNAMMTVLAMPFALSDGTAAGVVIDACGVRHDITIAADNIRREPRVESVETAGLVRNGTSVAVGWPVSASGMLEGAEGDFLQLAEAFAWSNPHLHLTVDWFGSAVEHAATDPAWRRWGPGNPSCPHWYDAARLATLAASCIAADRDAGTDRTVREFVATFNGLKGTAKQKAVTDAAGLSGAKLSALATTGDVDRAATAALLRAMQGEATPVKPSRLGVLGREHVVDRLRIDAGCDADTIQYRKVEGTAAGLPFVVEVGFGVVLDEDYWRYVEPCRRLLTAVNCSPSIAADVFRDLGRGWGLSTCLDCAEADDEQPVAVFAHLSMPGLSFADRGKSSVLLPPDVGDAIDAAAEYVTKAWSKQRKAEQRSDAARDRRAEKLSKRRGRMTVKDAAWSVMADAYAKAAGSIGQANARQIMYAARGEIQELAGKPLSDDYFTQTLLPDYMAEHPDLTAAWDVLYDARGALHEPHGRRSVPLGTAKVRDYLAGAGRAAAIPSVPVAPMLATAVPTCGPKFRYGAVLFIEKEGFLPLLEKARIAERYDLALMSTKGVSTTAARSLVDELCGGQRLPLLVLRDFDNAGFTIAHTLSNDTRRYGFDHEVNVVDLGLRLDDVRGWGLESEAVNYGKSDPRPNLLDKGATVEEVAFLHAGVNAAGQHHGRRVELNAFTSDQFIRWIEGKLDLHGIGKVVPAAADLTTAYRRALATHEVNAALPKLAEAARLAADERPVPRGLAGRVERMVQADRGMPWDVAIAKIAAGARGNSAS